MNYTATRDDFMRKAREVHDGLKERCLYNVAVTLYRRPRSTGPRSQNSRLYGHCSDLAEQVVNPDGRPTYTVDEIKQAMMRMAVGEGYPTHLSADGVEVPLPTRHSTMAQLNVVLGVIQQYADIHEFGLTEIDEESKIPYRSVGGRTLKEMEEYQG